MTSRGGKRKAKHRKLNWCQGMIRDKVFIGIERSKTRRDEIGVGRAVVTNFCSLSSFSAKVEEKKYSSQFGGGDLIGAPWKQVIDAHSAFPPLLFSAHQSAT
jgi:hypothetical protein